jgi:ArsR family transcriptional regulator
MGLVQIYQCLCDQTRLRILHLLHEGPLCVCHIQEILGEPQVKISKHLAYLRTRRLVEVRREANWMIYRLPVRPPRELSANLACLQDCAQEDPVFRRDAAKLRRLQGKRAESGPLCCRPKVRVKTARHSFHESSSL